MSAEFSSTIKLFLGCPWLLSAAAVQQKFLQSHSLDTFSWDISHPLQDTQNFDDSTAALLFICSAEQFLNFQASALSFSQSIKNTFGFFVIDDPDAPITLRARKEVGRADKDLNVLNSIYYPFTRIQMLEALEHGLSALTHMSTLKNSFDAFTQASVTAIESRDPTTKGHSHRVAELTVKFAQVVSDLSGGSYDQVRFSAKQIEEIRYAGLLHDFGKIGVREAVLQKEKKLYSHELERIQSRFALVKEKIHRNLYEEYLKKLIRQKAPPTYDNLLFFQNKMDKIQEELQFLIAAVMEANEPAVIEKEAVPRISELLAAQIFTEDLGHEHTLLTAEELNILSIPRGTLTSAERKEIETHVVHSYQFLVQIPWSSDLKNIPDIAHAHHECLNGTGYPRRLKGEDIPIQAQMMTIADIYDALVASDRPYKRALPVEKAYEILRDEAHQGKIDRELLEIFISKNIPGHRASHSAGRTHAAN